MGENLGTVRISPAVLATIASLTTRSVPGVIRFSRDFASGVDRILRGKGGDSVHIKIVDDAVQLDLYVVASVDANLYKLGREIQTQVSRAIKDMVGMPVLAVNVHIEDVEVRVADEEEG